MNKFGSRQVLLMWRSGLTSAARGDARLHKQVVYGRDCDHDQSICTQLTAQVHEISRRVELHVLVVEESPADDERAAREHIALM